MAFECLRARLSDPDAERTQERAERRGSKTVFLKSIRTVHFSSWSMQSAQGVSQVEN
jgi:hypothetical protein